MYTLVSRSDRLSLIGLYCVSGTRVEKPCVVIIIIITKKTNKKFLNNVFFKESRFSQNPDLRSEESSVRADSSPGCGQWAAWAGSGYWRRGAMRRAGERNLQTDICWSSPGLGSPRLLARTGKDWRCDSRRRRLTRRGWLRLGSEMT